MTRKAVGKRAKGISPNLPQHNLPEPFALLQTAGFEEQLDLYQEIIRVESPEEISSRVDTLTDMALDESYYSYSGVDTDENVDPRCFAPLQAVRALCYFEHHVLRVVPRLIPLFATDDLELREELPLLYACIGRDVAKTLMDIAMDRDADIYLRDGAAESLVEMTNAYPDLSSEVQDMLEKEVADCGDPELTAYFIAGLMDLGATETLPLIEEAFKSSRVDTEIVTLAEVYEHLNSISGISDKPTDKLKVVYMLNDDDEYDDDEDRIPFVAPEKVGRNDPCPCGSGKKYKKCCG